MRRRARHISWHIIGKGWFGLWALVMVLLVMGSVHTAGTAHADPATAAMSVVVPAPSQGGTTVQGPVGANVSVSVTQATAGATYTLGWATPAAGCTPTGSTAFTDTSPQTADSGGNFTATFSWPDAAGTPGALYLICAVDATSPTPDVITASQQFQVLGRTPPQITLQRAPEPTPTSGPTATPIKGFHAGGPLQVKGKGFLPQGTQIAIFATSSATFSASDYKPADALKTADGSPITSDSQGQFTAVVTLPNIQGSLFIHAVSTDAVSTGQASFPPSLVATRTIQIGAPIATPTPEVTATPTANGTGTPPPQSDNTMRIVAIATLGVLSLILFIIGGILVASVVLGPRTPPKLDSGTRSQPGAVRSGQQQW